MNLVFAVESRFARVGEGFFAIGSPGPYTFWQQYLKHFEHVTVMARVRVLDEIPKGSLRADGPGVDIFPLPDFVGPIQGLIRLPLMLFCIWRFVSKQKRQRKYCCYILRIPGGIATLLWCILNIFRIPYAVELVGDPNEALASKQFGSLLIGLLVRPIMVFFTRLQCRNAMSVHYVTPVLKHRYPPSKSANFGIWSDVVMPKELLTELGKQVSYEMPAKPVITFVGSLQRPYKGLGVLLEAFKLLLELYPTVELWVIGDGILRTKYEKYALDLGISDKVIFLGQLEHRMVFDKLIKSSLFVLPSFTEGLPRALIEAMAVGLPCIATTVGGIPDLLPQEVLVPPGDIHLLYQKIKWMFSSKDVREKYGKLNRKKVLLDFNPEILNKQKNAYLKKLKTIMKYDK